MTAGVSTVIFILAVAQHCWPNIHYTSPIHAEVSQTSLGFWQYSEQLLV